MIKMPQRETKSLVALHGWTAVVLGLLLYAVVATGTVAVFSDEILHWSVGDIKQENPFEYDVDTVVKNLSREVDPKFLEDVGLGTSSRGNLEIFFHTHREKPSGELEDYGVQFEVDPQTHEVLDKQLGTGEALHHQNEYASLSRFLVDIHTELHLPRPWGLLLTGILGLAMLVAAVSGVLMHRHLFTDMFVLRKKSNDVLKTRDLHTVAGTWSLPFAFILAFTGSFFSFAGAFGIPAMAMVAFEGDQEAMIRTIVGLPKTESEARIPTSNLNTIVEDGFSRTEQYPRFVSITHYGRGDSQVLLFLPAEESKLEPIQLEYEGASGDFVREKPSLGLIPSSGSFAFSLIQPLHFGDFAGLLSRFVWVALGFASCYVILSGMFLWVTRRGERWHRFACFVRGTGTGLPLAMLVSAVCYFISPTLGWSTVNSVPLGFLMSSVLILIYSGFSRSAEHIHRALLMVITLCSLALPLLRMSFGGPTWGVSVHQGNSVVIMLDLLLAVCAAYCFFLWRISFKNASLSVRQNKLRPDKTYNKTGIERAPL